MQRLRFVRRGPLMGRPRTRPHADYLRPLNEMEALRVGAYWRRYDRKTRPAE